MRVYSSKLIKDEKWWGGVIDDGVIMPFGDKNYKRDLLGTFTANQANSLFVSNKGRYIYSDEPFEIEFDCDKEEFKIMGQSEVLIKDGHETLKGAYLAVAKEYLNLKGKIPSKIMFKEPQYNTWIEMGYNPTQEKVLTYAQSILDNGFPIGVLMIDDCWNEDYGVWDFHRGRFPNPKEMIKKLHDMGFKIMLWTCPFISPDSFNFRMLEKQGLLVSDENGEVVLRKWWNGYSAILDCTNPEAVKWYKAQNQRLIDDYNVDGFKLDAGDPEYYDNNDNIFEKGHRNNQIKAWAKIGLEYELNEYRACWQMAGEPLVQRLRDKPHSWKFGGLDTLVPNVISLGLSGYAYSCPDMIGGGLDADFLRDDFIFDQELFIRYAQCSALLPMMQFSIAPWKVLNEENLKYCKDAIKLHEKFSDIIIELAENSAITGEPIVRNMEYEFPNKGYEKILDQFMLGNNVLVAPVLEKGMKARNVEIPEGQWCGDDGKVIIGPCQIKIDTPLNRLPYFTKIMS